MNLYHIGLLRGLRDSSSILPVCGYGGMEEIDRRRGKTELEPKVSVFISSS